MVLAPFLLALERLERDRSDGGAMLTSQRVRTDGADSDIVSAGEILTDVGVSSGMMTASGDGWEARESDEDTSEEDE